MDMREYRWRTMDSWNKMKSRFYDEWEDAYRTMSDHQFRVTCHNGVHSARQVIDYFSARAKRMNDERWPDVKEDETA